VRRREKTSHAVKPGKRVYVYLGGKETLYSYYYWGSPGQSEKEELPLSPTIFRKRELPEEAIDGTTCDSGGQTALPFFAEKKSSQRMEERF